MGLFEYLLAPATILIAAVFTYILCGGIALLRLIWVETDPDEKRVLESHFLQFSIATLMFVLFSLIALNIMHSAMQVEILVNNDMAGLALSILFLILSSAVSIHHVQYLPMHEN